ncbi:hypothetical protein KAFR_0B03020 [Kazachstania africana CBS 2517]|uniref:Cleavage and polyadenylation specificity factor subunit 2 n=1 Tax=Kazachstania africana (strain ATCC 22294 / BCRC 22015 / CBS 2517 / CECT 1963 / NBRC 1671 / NRRL Y-8276) TaxID=1071382 RepID=H2AQE8_KAZAF|nr:hypothetical protein KAFR_0B03020 [Kazachstania africana CBS 2517]CCF56598.1 hypothetical protein KAFR_0B03020 [Kazachstania africana CBS 2517]
MTYKLSCCDDGSGVTVGTILRFEFATILIDPGWNNKKVSYEECVRYWSNIIPEVDIVLLSQPTIECIGAYTLLHYNFLSHFISRIEVYATLPVTNLGRVSTIDLYASKGVIGPYTTNQMNVEDIEKSYDHVKALKFSQMVDLKSTFDGLSLVAYNSGYTTGGSIWCIMTHSEKLLYARRWNHTKNNILDASALLGPGGKPSSALMRPSAIITTLDRFGSPKPYKKRSKMFKDLLRKSVTSGGSAVIPVEIGENFLDLLVLVHDFLYENSKSGLISQLNILLVSYSKGRIVTYAKSMLEWLSSSAIKTWESRDSSSPFELGKNFNVILPSEISKYPGSKICFVSQLEPMMDEVIENLGQNETSTILLTSKVNRSEIVSEIYKEWTQLCKKPSVEEGQILPYSSSVLLKKVNIEPLRGHDLDEFKKSIEERKEKRSKSELLLRKEAKNPAKSLNTDRVNGGSMDGDTSQSKAIDEDDDEEEEEEEEDNLLRILKGQSGDKLSGVIEYPVDTYVQTTSTPKNKMFQFNPRKEKRDDYGTIVDYSMFISKEEEEEESKNANKRPQESQNVSNNLSKRSRRDTNVMNGSTRNAENFDNIDYLNTDKDAMKIALANEQVILNCSIAFINMENVVDQRSTSIIWPSLKPKKMILLAPETFQDQNTVTLMEKKGIEMFAPQLNEYIEFSTTIKALDISLDPELDKLLKWQKIGDDHTVAHVVGRVVRDTIHNSMRNKLVLKPISSGTKMHTKSGLLSIGEVRLAEVKRKLTEQGHVAEFQGEGTLVVNNEVMVRRISDGETIIDGSPSELFDIVKKSITEMLAKV